MKFEDFTQEERTIIAEFVYSYDNEVLIKADALELVDVFLKKKLIDEPHAVDLKERINKNTFVLEEMTEILFTSLEYEEGVKIMNEYFGK